MPWKRLLWKGNCGEPSQVAGAVTRRTDGVALIATGPPLLALNQVIVDGDDATTAAIAGAVAVMRERRDRFVVSLRMGTDDRFVPFIAELGLRRDNQQAVC